MEAKKILLAEDDPKDVELTLAALAEYNLANEVVVPGTGPRRWIICTGGGSLLIALLVIPWSCSSI